MSDWVCTHYRVFGVISMLHSVQQHGSKVMGDYTDLYRWISVTILGGTREQNAVEEYIRKEIYGHGGRYANLHRHGGPQFPLAADSETGVVTSKPTDTVPAHHVRQ